MLGRSVEVWCTSSGAFPCSRWVSGERKGDDHSFHLGASKNRSWGGRGKGATGGNALIG